MGGCSSDFYKTVKKQHGELFKDFIVGSQSLLQFKRLVKTKQQAYEAQAQQKRLQIHNEINKSQQLMLSHYQITKSDITQKLPLGIEDYEQMKKQRLSQVLGLQEYQRRFQGVHSQLDSGINERKQSQQKQLQQTVRKVESEYIIDSQKMKLFREMSEQRRAMIRQKGVKQFGEHIQKRMKDIQTKYQQQLDTQKQVKALQKIISLQQVDHLVNMAKNKFRTQSINVMGGFLDSEIHV